MQFIQCAFLCSVSPSGDNVGGTWSHCSDVVVYVAWVWLGITELSLKHSHILDLFYGFCLSTWTWVSQYQNGQLSLPEKSVLQLDATPAAHPTVSKYQYWNTVTHTNKMCTLHSLPSFQFHKEKDLLYNFLIYLMRLDAEPFPSNKYSRTTQRAQTCAKHKMSDGSSVEHWPITSLLCCHLAYTSRIWICVSNLNLKLRLLDPDSRWWSGSPPEFNCFVPGPFPTHARNLIEIHAQLFM